MPTVLMCQGIAFEWPPTYQRILAEGGLELRFAEPRGKKLTAAELGANLDGISAVIASLEPYTAEVLAAAPGLRVIARNGVGYDSVDVPAATARNVVVSITPGVNQEAVAEHTFALLLACTKRLVTNHEEMVAGGFGRRATLPLRGKTLGLVGLGRIGREVARRAAAFGMRTLAFDPFGDPAAAAACGATLVGDRDEFLAACDFVSLHAPAGEATRCWICRDTIERMKDGAIVINTARGSLVDEAALAAALQSGKLAAAGLDAFVEEPPVGSPLLSAPNVVYSPHLAGGDQKSVDDMAASCAQTIVDLHHGRWPADKLVNGAQLVPGWKW